MSGGWRSGLACEIVNSASQGNFAFFREKSGTMIFPLKLKEVGMWRHFLFLMPLRHPL